MFRFGRRFYWPLAIAAYWLCALWLLLLVSPISFDGGGPVVTFYWGSHPPTPTLTEYNRTFGARLPFLYTYWVAASAITLVGCVLATWLVRPWGSRGSLFLASSSATLLSLLVLGALSDAGIALHLWRGPAMYGGISYTLPFLKVLIPMSLLAGALNVARNRLRPET
jgi:hypothetical protein